VSAREERVVSAAVVVCVDRQCGGVVWRGRLWRESVRDDGDIRNNKNAFSF
jgi:hypothetical protein